jgi:hypothetical protein
MQIFHRATLTYTVMLFVLTTSIPGVHAQSHPGPRYAGCMEARELHLRNCTRNVQGICATALETCRAFGMKERER